MTDCLFCKMVAGDIQPDTVYEDDFVLAFRDINPVAPTHILIVPKKHLSSLNDTRGDDVNLLGKLLFTAKQIAEQEGIADSGFRTVINTNAAAGQTVFHIHVHVLGGRAMHWPPG